MIREPVETVASLEVVAQGDDAITVEIVADTAIVDEAVAVVVDSVAANLRLGQVAGAAPDPSRRVADHLTTRTNPEAARRTHQELGAELQIGRRLVGHAVTVVVDAVTDLV